MIAIAFSLFTFTLLVNLPHRNLLVGFYHNCHTLEWQLFYRDAEATAVGAPKEMRLLWERNFNATTGTYTWKSVDQTSMPDPIQVQSVNNHPGAIFFHCTWDNSRGLETVTLDQD